MTTIDRITKRIDELKKSTCTKSIVDELERVKAELTAVKGVDELISLVDERKKIIDDGIVPTDRIIGYQNCVDGLERIIKALKQTPVVSEECCCDEEGMCKMHGDRLKDSQPKVGGYIELSENQRICRCGKIVYKDVYCACGG